MKSGGFHGYVRVEEKRLFWWKVAEFSIFAYGTNRAFEKAANLKELLEKNCV